MSEIRTASFKIDDFLFPKTFETPMEIQGMPRRVSREGAGEYDNRSSIILVYNNNTIHLLYILKEVIL